MATIANKMYVQFLYISIHSYKISVTRTIERTNKTQWITYEREVAEELASDPISNFFAF